MELFCTRKECRRCFSTLFLRRGRGCCVVCVVVVVVVAVVDDDDDNDDSSPFLFSLCFHDVTQS